MIQLDIIKPIHTHQIKFLTPHYAIPKPYSTTEFRIIGDFRTLNKFIQPMPSPIYDTYTHSTWLSQYKYKCKIDLSNGYYNCHVHPDSQPYLAFMLNNKSYTYKRLPQGLSTSPATFQHFAQHLISHLSTHLQQHIHAYLDDFLIGANSLEECNSITHQFIDIIQNHNTLINYKKSSLTPSTSINALGFHIDTSVHPSPIHLASTQNLLRRFIQIHHITKRQRLKLIGKIQFMSRCIPTLKPLFTPLYTITNALPTFHSILPLSSNEVFQYQQLINYLQDPSTIPQHHTTNIYTDASNTHYSSQINNKIHTWKHNNQYESSTYNELQAIAYTLNKINLQNISNINWYTDSQAAIQIINNKTSTSPKLLQILHNHILPHLDNKHINFIHVKGSLNTADPYSKPYQLHTTSTNQARYKETYRSAIKQQQQRINSTILAAVRKT